MTVKCMIIDDEPLAIRVLENHIQKIPWLDISFTCTNPVEAIEQVKQKKADLIFLDIQMPELTGLEFLESLPRQPVVIFTTAYIINLEINEVILIFSIAISIHYSLIVIYLLRIFKDV